MLYLFENIETGFLLRFTRLSIADDDFGTLYLFTEEPSDTIWVSSDIEDLNFILENDFIHPQYSMFGRNPSKEGLDFSKYKISIYGQIKDD